jgi:uncharacterized protein (TIGR03000 family)
MRVPADAEIWFSGEKTSQSGSFRQFVSPPLAAGREYTYEIRLKWREGERTRDQTRRVTFQAGDRIRLDYFGSDSAEARAYYFAPDSPGVGAAGGNSQPTSPTIFLSRPDNPPPRVLRLSEMGNQNFPVTSP